MIIGPAEPIFVSGIYAVIDACFPSDASERWPRAAIAELLKQPSTRVLVARHIDKRSDRVSGFVIARVAADQGEILNIAVLPDLRRRGAGAQLLDELLRAGAAEGVRNWSLEVRCDNDAAIALYRRAGFVVAGVRKNYYRRGTTDRLDAIVMSLVPI